MGLAPRERETLAAIENQLRTSDPRFATMFQLFDNLGPRSQGHLWVFLSVWLARYGMSRALMLLAAIATLVTTCAVAGVVLA